MYAPADAERMTEHITLLLHFIVLSMHLVLCRLMFTAVTVGMGVREVSQVSYYCTALRTCHYVAASRF